MTAGWTTSDVERWMEPGAWLGDNAVKTLTEVRRAAARLSASWGLEVDEVVSVFWELLQSPSLEGAENKAAYLWTAVKQRVSTVAAARDLLQSEREASYLKGSRGLQVDTEVDAIESAIARAYIHGGDVVELEARRQRLLVESESSVPVRGDVLEFLADEPLGSVTSAEVAAVEVATAVLIDAGWSYGRAARLMDTLIAFAESISANGAAGFEAVANRLRRRPGGVGRTGLSRSGWLAAIRLVFGSRSGEPGILPRMFGGESAQQVRRCERVQALAAQVTGRRDVKQRLAS